MPPQANANNLALPVTPPELCDLTTLEERLLSQRYPFMKLLGLVKGRQSGIKYAVVNVPVQAEQVCNALPKTPNGPHQATLVLIAYASSEGSGEPAHPRSPPEPSLLAHTSSESRGTFRQKARSLAL